MMAVPETSAGLKDAESAIASKHREGTPVEIADGCEIVAINPSKSMKVFVLCRTLESLRALRKISDSGELKSIIESWCNKLLAGTNHSPVKLKLLSLVDYCKCEDYFTGRFSFITIKFGYKCFIAQTMFAFSLECFMEPIGCSKRVMLCFIVRVNFYDGMPLCYCQTHVPATPFSRWHCSQPLVDD